jgi:predicted transcriptional regulator
MNQTTTAAVPSPVPNPAVASLAPTHARATHAHATPTIRDFFVTLMTMTETAVPEETDLATLVDLLDDDHVRTILAATSSEPLSATELGDVCGVSESTIYRRIDRLREVALVAEQTRPRTDGHHETVYVATLDRFEVELGDDGFNCSVKRRGDDMIDQLTRMWEGL